MSALALFTLVHVVISLGGIGSGLVVLWGLLSNRRLPRWTAAFLATTVATSVTGFLFPVHRLLPSHLVGLISLLLLTVAIIARYRFGLIGVWRAAYVITASASLYLNVFVLVAQLFMKVPFLASPMVEPLGPGLQVLVLLVFIVLTALATLRFQRVATPPQIFVPIT